MKQPLTMFDLIIIMTCTGIFGGTVNFFQLYSKENKGWMLYLKCVVAGVGASFLVPLFLQMISSNLIANSSGDDKDRNLLIFIGFCLVASIFSKKFIDTIGEKVLKEVKEAAKEVKEDAKEVKEDAKEAKEAKEAAKEAQEEVKEDARDVKKTAVAANSLRKIIDIENEEPGSEDIKIFVDDIMWLQELNKSKYPKQFTDQQYTSIISELLLGKYSYRTIQGIKKPVDFGTAAETKEILGRLFDLGYVEKKHRLKDDEELWKFKVLLITEKNSLEYFSWGNSKWEASIINNKYNWANNELLEILHRGKGSPKGHPDRHINYMTNNIENWTAKFKPTLIGDKVNFTFLLNKEGEGNVTEASSMELIDWENNKWNVSIGSISATSYSSDTKIKFICRKLI